MLDKDIKTKKQEEENLKRLEKEIVNKKKLPPEEEEEEEEEEEKENSIKQILTNLSHEKELKIAVIIGPEGGISKEEVELLNELPNLKTVTLGKRILRTETAPLVLASVIMYEFDEME